MAFRETGCSRTSTIADCVKRAWAIWLKCDDCQREVVLDPWTLANRFAPAAAIGDLADRFTCRCGGKTGLMSTVSGHKYGPAFGETRR